MQTSDTIRDLYNNYYCNFIKLPARYYELEKKSKSIQNELKITLTKKQKKKLDKLCDTLLIMSIIQSEELFIYGFSVATHILSESLDIKF